MSNKPTNATKSGSTTGSANKSKSAELAAAASKRRRDELEERRRKAQQQQRTIWTPACRCPSLVLQTLPV